MKHVCQWFLYTIIVYFTASCSEPDSNITLPEPKPNSLETVNSVGVSARDLDDDDELTDKEKLGKLIFFDANLSEPAGQSCASCHDPNSGFADPDRQLPVSEGVIAGRFGSRNALSAGYTKFTPPFTLGDSPMQVQGGQFWDGRKIDLIEQAKAPFLNPLEMNNPDKDTVVADVMAADYSALFLTVYGADAFADIDAAYHNIADAIATYEGSVELSPFTSKYDQFKAGTVALSAEEALGLELFIGKGKCANCHSLNSIDNGMNSDIFTNFRFGNIGLPRNTEFPYNLLPEGTIDNGLGAFLEDPQHNGKFKTPHLRNVALTGPYMHNGLLKTLEEVVHFYNTRDIPGLWPEPEVSANLVTGLVGDLGLTEDEEEAIVEFLKTLTDTFGPGTPIGADNAPIIDVDDD